MLYQTSSLFHNMIAGCILLHNTTSNHQICYQLPGCVAKILLLYAHYESKQAPFNEQQNS